VSGSARAGGGAGAEADDVAAVVAVHGAYYAAFEEGDLDAMSALWVDEPYADSAWVVHPGMRPIRGRDRVLRSYAAAMASTTYLQFVLTDLAPTVVGELAVVGCVENVLAAESDGAPLGGGTIVATNVLRRTAHGWRVAGHHGSGVLIPRTEDR
jgi:ketosteroid isomerase-like protein